MCVGAQKAATNASVEARPNAPKTKNKVVVVAGVPRHAAGVGEFEPSGSLCRESGDGGTKHEYKASGSARGKVEGRGEEQGPCGARPQTKFFTALLRRGSLVWVRATSLPFLRA
jgi:hypothetical protein